MDPAFNADAVITSLNQNIAVASTKPKGVLVSYELFNALHERGLLELKLATPGGIPALENFGAIIPFYRENIYIHCDPINLPDGDSHYRLPPAL
jgi:hypothetical protein